MICPMKRIKSDQIILEDRLFDGYVYVENGIITDVTTEERPADEVFDMTGYYVSPGFIDIHTHGGGGYRFEGSTEEIVNGCNFHLTHGTTAICPTVSAAPFASMEASARNIKAAMTDPRVKGTILGVHMEGPYLSAKQAGAQCPIHITPPMEEDYLPFIRENADVISRWTYAPENDTDERFVKTLQEYGIIPSAGHTDAIYGDLLRAYEHGCALVTHLYSCTSTVTRDHGFRRLGVIETAYLTDGMFVEIICDGKHLPPDLIRLIVKIKGKPNKVVPFITHSGQDGLDFPDNCCAALVYDDGTCFVRTSSVEVNGWGRRQFVVCGTKGTIEIKPIESPMHVTEAYLTEGKSWSDTHTEVFPPAQEHRYSNMLIDFAKMIRGEGENPYTYEHDLYVHKATLAACGFDIEL